MRTALAGSVQSDDYIRENSGKVTTAVQTGGQNGAILALPRASWRLKTFCWVLVKNPSLKSFFHFFLTKLGWHIESNFFFSHICRRPIGFHAFPTVSHFKLVPYVEETGSCFERPNGNQAGELSGLSSIFDAWDCFAPHHNWSSRHGVLWGKPWTIHAADEHNNLSFSGLIPVFTRRHVGIFSLCPQKPFSPTASSAFVS